MWKPKLIAGSVVVLGLVATAPAFSAPAAGRPVGAIERGSTHSLWIQQVDHQIAGWWWNLVYELGLRAEPGSSRAARTSEAGADSTADSRSLTDASTEFTATVDPDG